MTATTTPARCSWSDLPVIACDHCGAHPGNDGVIPRQPHGIDPQAAEHLLDVPLGLRTSVRPADSILWPHVPTPGERPALRLGTPEHETCACGKPTRDQAIACDDCADELARLLGDVPWLVEQLNLAVTGQRAKRPGADRGGDGLPWNDAAATTLAELRNELVGLIRICDADNVAHQSPSDERPADTCEAMSRWLLWRVDGLTRHDAWTDTLRNLRRIEGDTLRIIDNPPALLFLGWCIAETDLGECAGPVYAREGQADGACRICRAPYPVEASRAALAAALDDRLCTAAEIAHLSTYLGLHVSREQVRKVINTWHKRGRITSAGERDGCATFRYGAVRVMLSLTYEDREVGA